ALANLNYVMNTEKIYIEPQLNLKQLAEQINLTPHQLSELLNHEIGQNFNTYLMQFRVKAAIKLLKKEPDKTILGIALSVGFNSNSAFYSAFRKITGKSPGDFRDAK
ncbi:MAG: helix-turn-helix domain-containing protein, partial [Candidatus Margulisiibacteriota bacterium]